jgi:NAD(P)-dependent dehydrogenase (short-subunit alcohol dehydrogenase family)
MKVDGKVIAVTGAGNGVGRAVTLEALRRGARVAAIDAHQPQQPQPASERQQRHHERFSGRR